MNKLGPYERKCRRHPIPKKCGFFKVNLVSGMEVMGVALMNKSVYVLGVVDGDLYLGKCFSGVK